MPLFSILVIVVPSLLFYEGTNCQCGSFETGVIKYQVEPDSSCGECAFIGEAGMIGYFEPSEGQWMLIEVVKHKFEDIKKDPTCCR